MAFYPRRRSYSRARSRGSTQSYKKGFAQGLAAAQRGLRPRRRRW